VTQGSERPVGMALLDRFARLTGTE